MVIADKQKRQLAAVIMLLLAILGLRFELVGMQTLCIATGQLIRKQSWGSAFDLVVALVTLVYPATGIIGVIIAYVEYVLSVQQD